MNDPLLDQPLNFLQWQQSFKESYFRSRQYRCIGGFFFVIAVSAVVINFEDVIPGCDDHPSACSYVPLWLFLCAWAVMICSCAKACRQEDLQQRMFEQLERSFDVPAIADATLDNASSSGPAQDKVGSQSIGAVGLLVPGVGAD